MCIEKGKTMSSVTVVIINKTDTSNLNYSHLDSISSCFAVVNEG